MDLWTPSTLVLIACLLLTLIFLTLKYKYNFWTRLHIETTPYSIPLGHFHDVILLKTSFGDKFFNIYKSLKSRGLRHGGAYIIFFPIYVPVDINIVKSIMQLDFQHFTDRGMYYNEKSDPLSAHLFNLEGSKWKLLRNKLSPTFTSGKIKMMFDTLVNCNAGLYKVMDKELGNTLDIKDILERYTIDMIGSCGFGIECNTLENPKSDFKEKGKLLFEKTLFENIKLFVTTAFPKMMRKLDVRVTPTDVTEFFVNVVKDTVAYREKNDIYRKDFMHLLIQLKNRGKVMNDEKLTDTQIAEAENRITIEQICAQAYVFFEGGFETSSTVMAFCLYELGKNKILQDKVRQDIKKALDAHHGKFTYEAVIDMTYLEQTVYESMRKYPPVPMLSRICTKDYKIPGTETVLQKGVRVTISALGIQRDPEFYPDPERFDPDRFSEENKKTRPPSAFLSFGVGPRICIASRFGLLQTKVGVASLLMKYEFSVNSKTKEPLEFDPKSILLSTKGGLWLDFKKLS